MAILANPPARADDESYFAAFEAVQASPGDPEASFIFAQAAVRSGRIREALAALDRLLRIDPSLSNIKLELGVLHLSAGSPALAERYIAEALEDPNAPPGVRARAETLLASARRIQEPTVVSGEAFVGFRAESNATAAPDDVVLIPGSGNLPFLLSADDLGEADQSGFWGISGRVVHDLGFQEGHALIFNAGYFGNRYFENSQLNLHILDADLGVAFNFGGAALPVRVTPLLLADLVLKDDELFENDLGGGLKVEVLPSQDLLLGIEVEGGYTEFHETDAEPFNDERDGVRLIVRPVARYQATREIAFFVSPELVLNEADAGFESYTDLGVAGGVIFTFDDLLGRADRPWTVSLNGRYRNREFDAPDPLIDPNTVQEDDRFDLGARVSVPVTGDVLVSGAISYTENSSSYDVNAFDNLAGTVFVSVRF